jgi:hypothetical protein
MFGSQEFHLKRCKKNIWPNFGREWLYETFQKKFDRAPKELLPLGGRDASQGSQEYVVVAGTMLPRGQLRGVFEGPHTPRPGILRFERL